MTSETAFDSYVAAREAGQGYVLWETISAELETTVAAALKLGAFDELGLMFESVEGGESLGRYSFIGIDPDKVWRHEDGKTSLGDRAEDGVIAWHPEDDGLAPLDSLRAFSEASRAEMPAPLPPMSAGVFGYFGYEMVQHFERAVHANPNDLDLPDAMLVRPRTVVVFDRAFDTLYLVAPLWADSSESAEANFAAAERRLAAVKDQTSSIGIVDKSSSTPRRGAEGR